MEKKLVWKDRNSINEIKTRSLEKLKHFNSLVSNFHQYQPFTKIASLEDAMKLIKSPIDFFCKTVIKAANMPSAGGLSASIEAVCQIYGVKLDEYRHAIGKAAKPVDTSFSSDDPIIFENNEFVFDESKFLILSERYNVYAINQAQIDFVNYWESVCMVLNNHFKKGFITSSKLNEIAKGCGFIPGVISTEGQQFSLDEMYLVNQISNLK